MSRVGTLDYMPPEARGMGGCHRECNACCSATYAHKPPDPPKAAALPGATLPQPKPHSTRSHPTSLRTTHRSCACHTAPLPPRGQCPRVVLPTACLWTRGAWACWHTSCSWGPHPLRPTASEWAAGGGEKTWQVVNCVAGGCCKRVAIIHGAAASSCFAVTALPPRPLLTFRPPSSR